MLKEETLKETENQTYEEPEGEVLEFISSNVNTITVLTRVDAEKGGVESSPIDPAQFTVREIQEAMQDASYDWNQPALRGLLEAEKEGQGRTTAIKAIEERIR